MPDPGVYTNDPFGNLKEEYLKWLRDKADYANKWGTQPKRTDYYRSQPQPRRGYMNPGSIRARNESSKLAQRAYRSYATNNTPASYNNALAGLIQGGTNIGDKYAGKEAAYREAHARALAKWMKEKHLRQLALQKRRSDMWLNLAGGIVGGVGSAIGG